MLHFILLLFTARLVASAPSNQAPLATHEFISQCNDTSGVCEFQLTIPVSHAKKILNDTTRTQLVGRIEALERQNRVLVGQNLEGQKRLDHLHLRVDQLSLLLQSAVDQANEMEESFKHALNRLNRSIIERCRSPCGEQPNVCASQPCLNGGQCVSGNHDFRCECPPGWAGRYCEIDINLCSRLRHLGLCHHGHCENGTGIPRCQCDPGFHGDRCDIPLDPCVGVECLNDGRCEAYGSRAVCQCTPDFQGRRCERRIDLCPKFECLNGGQCINNAGSVVCICPPGFQGPRCDQKVDLCSSNPCYNGGVCKQTAHGNEFQCTCPSAFEGERCEKNVPMDRQLSGCGDKRYVREKQKFYSHLEFEKDKHSDYPSDLNCTWTLVVDKKDDFVKLKAHDFWLKRGRPLDFVAIYAGDTLTRSRLLDIFTAESKQPHKDKCYKTNTITVNFVSFAEKTKYDHHKDHNGHGFRMYFDDC